MPSLASLLVPLFGAIFVGAGLRAAGLFDGEDGRRMARFVFMVAMPFAGFSFMKSQPLDADLLVGVATGYLISLAMISGAVFFVARRFLGLTIREAGAAVFTATCGNAIFLGIPIAAAVPGWAPPFLILVLLEGSVVFAIASALMTWPEDVDTGGAGSAAVVKSLREAALRAVKSPIVLGTLAGLLANITALPVPGPIDRLFILFAQATTPLGLFVLGVNAMNLLLERKVADLRGAALLLPFKLLVFPLLTAGLVWLFTGNMTATAVAALFTGLPPAVASIVLASVYGQWVRGVSGVVTIGTLLGLVTLTLFLTVAVPS